MTKEQKQLEEAMRDFDAVADILITDAENCVKILKNITKETKEIIWN